MNRKFQSIGVSFEQKNTKLTTNEFRFKLLAVAIGLILSPSAWSAVCTGSDCTFEDLNIEKYTAKVDGDGNVTSYGDGTLLVGAGQTIKVTGSAAYEGGVASAYSTLKAKDAISQGYIKYTGNISDLENLSYVSSLGKQDVSIQIIDPSTGKIISVATYNPNQVDEKTWLENTSVVIYPGMDGSTPNPAIPTGYLKAPLAVVNGGTLDVNMDRTVIGSTSVKDTSYFIVNEGTLNWNSTNSFTFANAQPTLDDLAQHDQKFVNKSYIGEFEVKATVGGKEVNLGTQVVSDKAGYALFNNWLIDQLNSGKLGYGSDAQKNYDKLIAQATTGKETNIEYGIAPLGYDEATGDPITVNGDDFLVQKLKDRIGILADGANAVVNITQSGDLLVGSTGRMTTIRGGGTINNYGVMTNYNSTTAVYVENGKFNNYGIRNLGTTRTHVAGLSTSPDFATGEKAVYNNNGIVNLFPFTYDGVNSIHNKYLLVRDNGTATNDGVINIGTLDASANIALLTGVEVSTGTFVNNGMVYIGRKEGTDLATNPGGVDVAITSQTKGLYGALRANIENAENGQIIIGRLVQNAAAIYAISNLGNIVNNGTITINGGMDVTAPFSNYGIYSDGSTSKIDNKGTINVNGVNNIGVFATNGGKAISSGDIVIGGDNTGTGYNNYGILAEGISSTNRSSVIDLSGTITMQGDGAVGAAARGGGTINITGNGKVQFTGGKNQIGYLIVGSESSLNNTATGKQDVTTEGSTLFRLENGAVFKGGSGTSASLTASGNGSVAVYVSGGNAADPNAEQFNSGNMELNVVGSGAKGLVVEGGAKGTITNGATINLKADGAIAAMVDGQKHSVAGGAPSGGIDNTTTLTSSATLVSDKSNVTGYLVTNDANLIHSGQIDFTGLGTGNTGVQIASGRLDNQGSITTNGISVNIAGAGSYLTNSGTITATGDSNSAAINLGAGAELTIEGDGNIVAKNDAHGVLLDTGAQGLSFGSGAGKIIVEGKGHGIENAAETAGLALTDVRIDVTGNNGVGIRTGITLDKTNTGTINISGNDGIGLLFADANNNLISSDLDMSDSSDLKFVMTGVGGKGISTNTSGDIKTGASVDIQNASGGSALVVEGTTKTVTNTGDLTSVSTLNDLIILSDTVTSFTNSGNLTSGQNVLNLASNTQALTFTNEGAGKIEGLVALGSGNDIVNLKDTSTVQNINVGNGDNVINLIDNTTGQAFTQLTAGTGVNDTLNLNNSNYTLTNSGAISGVEKVNVNSNSTLTLQDQLLLGNANETGTLLNVAQNGTVAVDTATDFTLNNILAGSGNITVSTSDNQFSFGSNVGSSFSGNVTLQDTLFTLIGSSNTNAQAIANATLVAGAGSTTIVDGKQTIGGLAFDGGSVDFGTIEIGQKPAAGSVAEASNSINTTTGTLDITGAGTIVADIANIIDSNPNIAVPSDTLSLLEQDDANILVTIASGNSVLGSGGSLTLKDHSGNEITSATEVIAAVEQDGAVVADATYNYGLTGNGNGLHINYGLTQLAIKNGETLVLATHGDGSDTSTDLGAKLTGTGNLQIGVANTSDTISLSDTNNDYSGTTTIIGGNTLKLGADNVLGNTTELTLADNSTVNFDGYSQTVNGNVTTGSNTSLQLAGGQLTVNQVLENQGSINLSGGTLVADSIVANGNTTNNINLAGGNLTINNGGDITGRLMNSVAGGQLNVAGGTLNIAGANAGLSANTTTTLGAGSNVNLDSLRGLGASAIDLSSGSNLNLSLEGNAYSGQLANSLTGAGNVAFINTSASASSDGLQVTLSGNNSSFAGVVDIGANTELLATAASQLGSASITNTGILNLNYSGASDWEFANTVTGTGDFYKNGTGKVILQNDLSAGLVHLQGGSLQLGSATAGIDLTTTDGLVVDNGTNLYAYAGGSITGKLTNNGSISFMPTTTRAGGTWTITGDYENNGTFTLASGTSVGNTLHVTGDLSSTGGNSRFVMNSQLDIPAGDKIQVDGIVSDQHTLAIADQGVAPGLNKKLTVVSTGGGTGNFNLDGNTMDFGTYKYQLVKEGNDWVLKSLAATVGGSGSGRAYALSKGANAAVGIHSGLSSVVDTELSTLSSRIGELRMLDQYGKLGGLWVRNYNSDSNIDTRTSRSYDQSTHGMQIGADTIIKDLGNGRMYLGAMYGHAESSLDFEAESSGRIKSNTFGAYLTTQYDSGFYIDAVAKYSRLDNEVHYYSNMGQKIKGSYDTDAYTASVEVGKQINFAKDWYIEPQAQLSVTHIKGASYTTNNGMKVNQNDINSVQGRAGLELGKTFHFENGMAFQPYVKASLINEFKGNSKVRVNQDKLHSDMLGTRHSIGLGGAFKFSNNHKVFMDADYKNGARMEQPWGVNIGYRYTF